MKKLESLKELESCKIPRNQLGNLNGGVVINTSGSMNICIGNTCVEKAYVDKQDVTYNSKGEIISGGCLFDVKFLSVVNEPNIDEAMLLAQITENPTFINN